MLPEDFDCVCEYNGGILRESLCSEGNICDTSQSTAEAACYAPETTAAATTTEGTTEDTTEDTTEGTTEG